MSDEEALRRGWADWYVSRGWTPTPIALGEKGPRLSGWSRLRLDDGALTLDGAPVGLDVFDGVGNVGVLTGAVSDGLADVDLDDPRGDVQALAPDFLPESMTFGRASKPRSHWLFRCAPAKHKGWTVPRLDADGAPVLDADGKATTDTLLELRADGGQTMFPPSTHPSGELVEWSEGLDVAAALPLDIGRLDLEERCRRLAVAALLVREGMDRGGAASVARDGTGEALRERLRFEPHRAAVAKWFGLAGAPVEVPRAPSRAPDLIGSNERPGDWLARNVSWAEILTPHGWTEATPINGFPSWRRPGKTAGERSAYVSSDGGRLFVMTTNGGALDAGDYDKIGALARLEGLTVGDAARLIRERFGMPAATSWRDDAGVRDIADDAARRFLDGAGRVNAGGGAFLEDGSRAAGAAPGAPGAPVVASTKSAAPGVRRGSGVGWPAPPPLGRLNLSRAIPPPDREMLLTAPDGESVKGFLPSGIVGLLIAGGGTGKTQALIQLALTVATGADWLGTYKLAPRRVGTGTGFGRVLLALGEEDEEEINRRLWKAVEALDLWHLSDAINRLIVPYPLLGVQCGLTWSDDGKSPETPTEWSARFREMLAADAAINGPWRCIILDPATRFMGASGETDNKAATEWVREVSRLVELDGGPTVLIAHHSTKSALKEGGADQTAARGSSALVDGARWVANLGRGRGHVKGEIVLSLVKHNYVGPAAPVSLLYDSKGYLRKMTDEEREALTVEALAAGLEAEARTKELKAKAEAKTNGKAPGETTDGANPSPLPAVVTGNAGRGGAAPKAPTKSTKSGGGNVSDYE